MLEVELASSVSNWRPPESVSLAVCRYSAAMATDAADSNCRPSRDSTIAVGRARHRIDPMPTARCDGLAALGRESIYVAVLLLMRDIPSPCRTRNPRDSPVGVRSIG